MIFLTSNPKGVYNVFSKFCGSELNHLVPGFAVSRPITPHPTLQSHCVICPPPMLWVIPCFLVSTAITLPWNTLYRAPSTWKVENDLEKLGEELMPL